MSESNKVTVVCDIYSIVNKAIENNLTIKEYLNHVEKVSKITIITTRNSRNEICATSEIMYELLTEYYIDIPVVQVKKLYCNSKAKIDLHEWLEKTPKDIQDLTTPKCDPNKKYKIDGDQLFRLNTAKPNFKLKDVMESKDLDTLFKDVTSKIAFVHIEKLCSWFYQEYLEWAKTKVLYGNYLNKDEYPQFLDHIYLDGTDNHGKIVDVVSVCLHKHKLSIDSLVAFFHPYALAGAQRDAIKERLIVLDSNTKVSENEALKRENEMLKKQLDEIRKLM